jgi:transcriptional regulator with XRE-family HTH domain
MVEASSKTTRPELKPDDIRRIRESLGLSQVEAGELLGGGPRAFTKYESGTIKPAASVANLLRLLEADPSTLSTLAGRKMTPIANDEAKPFQVTSDHIAALSDRKLVALTRRLLAAEAQTHVLPKDGIHVSSTITAPDGGEDARIEWQGGPERTPFLPARLTQFQLKATDIGPKEAGDEILTAKTNQIKPMVRDALAAGGAYIVLCTHPYTRQQTKKRADQILKALADNGISADGNRVQFRDASQIAEWVNTSPPVATWVLEQTQPGLAGWFRDWTHWAGRSDHDGSTWVPDSRLDPLRTKLRQLVTPLRGVVRIVGLSGIGKSRLTLEALGPTEEEEATGQLLSDLVLYAVESEAGATAMKSAVQNLADSSVRAIVVVDQCATDTHRDLAAIVKRSSSRLSLVTIDPELPAGNLPSDALRLEPADAKVVEAILKQAAPNLQSDDQRRLLKFSSGYPKMALLLGQAWLKDGSIATVSDDELVERVLVGRSLADRQSLLDAGMLLGTFGLLGTKSPSTDIEDVAPLARNKTADELRAALGDLSARGVAENRGRLLALQPRPVALRLAERQWRQWSDKRWDEILAGSLPKHLRTKAADQLALLNDRPIATEVTKYVCRLNGPFASLDALGVDGNAEILSSLAEIDAEAVVMLIERLIDPLSLEERKKIDGDLRRHLVWALEKIAFLEKTFEQGASLLFKLALAENETWDNNATGEFKAIFPALLGNTAADGRARLRLLDELVDRNDPVEMPLVVGALLKGATMHSYSRGVGPEIQGSRPVLAPWQPKTWKDVFDYIIDCVERLVALAKRNDAIGAQARQGLGHNLRLLVSRGFIDKVEKWAADISADHRYWPEAIDSLADVLQYDKAGIEPGVAERVQNLIDRLTPDDLRGRAKFLLTDMPWDYLVDETHDFEAGRKRQLEAVEQLTGDLLREPTVISELLPQLSAGEHRMVYEFGRNLAKQAPKPLEWLMPIKAEFVAAPTGQKNERMLVGYLTGLADTHPDVIAQFKKEAISSMIFGPVLVMIMASIGITEADVKLVSSGLHDGKIAPKELMTWTVGGVLKTLPPEVLTPLFDQLLAMDGDAYSVALDLMGMYVHGTQGKVDSLRPQLVLAATTLERRRKKPGSQMDAYHFKVLIGWLLGRGWEDTDARLVAVALANHLARDPDGEAGEMIKPLLPKLLSKFSGVVWPILAQAIGSSDKLRSWRMQSALGDPYSFGDRKSPPILSLPEDVLFAWCHAQAEVGPAFVAGVASVLASNDANAPNQEFHPIIRRLLDEFGDRDDVLKHIEQNMHSFGWMGSLTTYFVLYQGPLTSLQNHPKGSVRRWAKKMLASIEHQISVARDDDDEQRAHWDI